MIVCDRCDGKEDVTHVAFGRCSPMNPTLATQIKESLPAPTFEADLCGECRVSVVMAIKKAGAPERVGRECA